LHSWNYCRYYWCDNLFFQKKLTVNFSRLIEESFNHLFILHHILYNDALAGGEISLSFFELKTRHFHPNPGPKC